MINSMLHDKISLLKNNGDLHENIKASVQGQIIFIGDTNLPMEEGDVLTRKLPNGNIDKYIVLETGLITGFDGKAHHFETEVRKMSSIEVKRELSGPIQQTINHISGNNARVNMNSTDNSTNIVKNNDIEVFTDLRKIIQSSKIDQKGVDLLIDNVNEMENSVGIANYKNKFDEFISNLANYATVLGAVSPLIHKLTAFISN